MPRMHLSYARCNREPSLFSQQDGPAAPPPPDALSLINQAHIARLRQDEGCAWMDL